MVSDGQIVRVARGKYDLPNRPLRSRPAMGVILVGMATPQQFEDALAAVQKGPLPPAAVDRLSVLQQTPPEPAQPPAISVPAEDLAGEAQAAHSVRARCKPHAAGWHLEDVCPGRCVEHVRPLEEARERLAVLAVADEAKAGVRRNFARDTAHAAAPAAKREVLSTTLAVHRRSGQTRRRRGMSMGRYSMPAEWLRVVGFIALIISDVVCNSTLPFSVTALFRLKTR
jgi:hypothetical protein